MNVEITLKTARTLKLSALILGLIFGVLVFIFALMSGAEADGNDFRALLKNSPNALPWLFFLVLLWFAWKQELMGGMTLMGLGISLFFLFDTFSDFQLPAFLVALYVILNGTLFVSSWWIKKEL